MSYDLLTVAAFFVVQFADVWTTNKILDHGGREMNPFIRWIMDKTGDQWPVFKVIAALIPASFLWVNGQTNLIWFVTGITALVALNNLRVLRKMTR